MQENIKIHNIEKNIVKIVNLVVIYVMNRFLHIKAILAVRTLK